MIDVRLDHKFSFDNSLTILQYPTYCNYYCEKCIVGKVGLDFFIQCNNGKVNNIINKN